MQQSIQEILAKRIGASNKLALKEQLFIESKEYRKAWLNGVKFFQNILNEERKKEGLKEFTFIIILMKLEHIREIDDLRWFYKQCKIYASKKDKYGKKQTFGKCFWGSLKIRY